MLKIDDLGDGNIRIQQGSIDVNVAAIFFAATGESGMVTIAPKSAGAYRSFSDPLENVEINGVNGSSYTPEEAVKELNSFIGINFKSGGTSSENNGGGDTEVIRTYGELVNPGDRVSAKKNDLTIYFERNLTGDTTRGTSYFSFDSPRIYWVHSNIFWDVSGVTGGGTRSKIENITVPDTGRQFDRGSNDSGYYTGNYIIGVLLDRTNMKKYNYNIIIGNNGTINLAEWAIVEIY